MKSGYETHLDDGRNPFPILERAQNFDLEHSEYVNERTTAVGDHVVNRAILRHELRDPFLGFSNLLNDFPPFVLQIANIPCMNEELLSLQFHEEPGKEYTYLIGHVIRFEPPKGKHCGKMIRGERVEWWKRRFKELAIKRAYLFLLSRRMTSTRCDRGPPTRPP